MLAAKLPDPPTVDPSLDGEPETKKQKVDADHADQSSKSYFEDFSIKSDDDWEEVDKSEDGRTEKLDDEPVQVDSPSSENDVQSVQSSGIIEMDDSHMSESLLAKDW